MRTSQSFPVQAEWFKQEAISKESVKRLIKSLSRDTQIYARKNNYTYVISVTTAREEGDSWNYVDMDALLLKRKFKEVEAFNQFEDDLRKFSEQLERKGLIKFVDRE